MLSCRLKRPRHPAAAGHSPVACSRRSSAAPSRQQIADPPRAELALFVPSIPNKFFPVCLVPVFLFFHFLSTTILFFALSLQSHSKRKHPTQSKRPARPIERNLSRL
ncbi:hypothetical protein HDV63DRAFT_30529 [Trichoderma sp. SZMC 28014]